MYAIAVNVTAFLLNPLTLIPTCIAIFGLMWWLEARKEKSKDEGASDK